MVPSASACQPKSFKPLAELTNHGQCRGKGTVPRKIAIEAVCNDKISAALNNHVIGISAYWDFLCMQRINGANGHAHAHLGSISSPCPFMGALAPDHLTVHILKADTAAFKADGINIGNIVTNNIKFCLVIAQSGYAGK